MDNGQTICKNKTLTYNSWPAVQEAIIYSGQPRKPVCYLYVAPVGAQSNTFSNGSRKQTITSAKSSPNSQDLLHHRLLS